jgi:Transglycosylase SLT domain/SPOR domain
MMQRGAFFLVLSWSVLATPALGQDFPTSTVGDDIGPPDGASQGVDRIAAVCQMIKSAASANDLPSDFLLRVIWQESRFKSDAIGPVTRSGARALGIAQFMPATAAERELASPFDPAQALPKAAEFLRELRSEFGNIGLAAAAYNAGPQRVRDWLAGKRNLPSQTQAYVQVVTGRNAGQWARSEPVQLMDARTKDVSCIEISRLEVPRAASTASRNNAVSAATQLDPKNPMPGWAVQLIGDESEAKALTRYAQLKKKHPDILSGFEPIVLHTGLSLAAAWNRVRIVTDTRQVAESLCTRLQSSGEHCWVQRN